MYRQSAEESPNPTNTANKARGFICPCGKSYLSYPALFTHIKQKHQGKAPGQVIRPKSLNKRGRPKKDFNRAEKDLISEAMISNDQSGSEKISKDMKNMREPRNNGNFNGTPNTRMYGAALRKANGQFIQRSRANFDKSSQSPNETQLTKSQKLLNLKAKIMDLFKDMEVSSSDEIKEIINKCETYEKLTKIRVMLSEKMSKLQKNRNPAMINCQQKRRFHQIQHKDYFLNQEGEEDGQLKSNSIGQPGQQNKYGQDLHQSSCQQQNENQFLLYNKKYEFYEIEMGVALAKFLSWVEFSLPEPECSQMNLLVAMLCQFFADEWDEECLHTYKFHNLVPQLNNFIFYYVAQLKKEVQFSQFYILCQKRPLQSIILLNQYMEIHKYTNYKVRINPGWKGEGK